MAGYPINKGIGHSVEFKGLKAQYLFIFAGGLLAVFFLVVVLYMAGADQLVCIGLGLTLGSLLVWGTFHLNNKYGEHGLMKLLAAKSHPRYILNRMTDALVDWVASHKSYTLLYYRKNERRIVALTMRKMQAPNQLAAVLLVSGSPDENLPYTLMPPMRPTTAPMA